MKLVIIFLLITTTLYSQADCEITYIANEGFLIETNGKKILIDGMFDSINGNWCDSPSDSVVQLMKAAKPPFDDLDIIAVTHNNIDHFNTEVVLEHLTNNSRGILICSNQAKEDLLKQAETEDVKFRILSFTPNFYQDTNMVVSDIGIGVVRLEHSHYMEEDPNTGEMVNIHRNTENLGFLFNVDGLKFFHCGDTNPLNEKEYSTFRLNEEKIQIAFLERQFFARGKEGTDIINKYIDPENIIVMHINPANKTAFLNYFNEVENITMFEKKMDSKTFLFD